MLTEIYNSLRERFEAIRDERTTHGNTATRIGEAFLALLDIVKDSIGNFLRRDTDDTASGHITFLKRTYHRGGADFGEYITGASGAHIDATGDAEFREIRGREALIVPEVRFELAKGVVGVETQCDCGGQIGEVDYQAGSMEGSCHLMLEDGEIGRIEVGDLCMGVWHDRELNGNADETSDDRQGNFKYKGFSTVYFMISDIPSTDNKGAGNSDRHYFKYQLRPIGSDLATAGGNGIHPYPLMHFYGRGWSGERTSANAYRSYFTLRTSNYTARLADVSSWKWSVANYTYVNGRLNGFESLLLPMVVDWGTTPKFGTIDCSLWMKGTIVQLPSSAYFLLIHQSKLGFLKNGESEQVEVTVYDGYRNDISSSSKVYVLRGDQTAVSEWTAAALANDRIGYAANADAKVFTLSYNHLLPTADETTFTVVARCEAGDKEVFIADKFVVMKSVATTMYEILPTDTAFHISKSGGLRPSIIGLSIVRIAGSLRQDMTAQMTDNLLVAYDGGRAYQGETELTGQDIGEDTRYVTVSLYDRDDFLMKWVDSRWVALGDDDEMLTPIAVLTIPVMRDGSDGESSVVADFDDEMHSVACDSEGSPLDGNVGWTTDARLWLGDEQLKLKTLTNSTDTTGAEIVSQPAGVACSVAVVTDPADDTKNCCRMTVKQVTAAAADETIVRVRLRGTTGDTAVATCRLIKSKAGADGVATTWNIVTVPSIIKTLSRSGETRAPAKSQDFVGRGTATERTESSCKFSG